MEVGIWRSYFWWVGLQWIWWVDDFCVDRFWV